MVRATFDALKQQQSPRHIAQRRGKTVQEIVQKRGLQGKEKAEAAAEA
jgi:small subunit ribosomal protein S5